MLSGYDSQPVGFYLGGEYYCPKCAGKKLGTLRAEKILVGLAEFKTGEGWDPDGLVWRWEVLERLAEIEAVKNEGRRAHKTIDWDEVNALEWGIRCSQCGDDLAPPETHKPADGGAGICRHCWDPVDGPIHEAAA